MGPAVPGTWSSALADAVRQGDPEGAVRAGLAAAEAKVAPLEIARPAALAYAEAVDVSRGEAPHGLLALSSAVRLARHLGPRLQALPVLRALALAASDPKLPPSERRRPPKVTGEISHLTRSFEYAVRSAAFGDAVSIFSGLLREGRERVMAGDVLFRVAAEDMVAGGHKLLLAVKGWQLASALGWRAGDVLMGPVVARVATGIQEASAYRTIMAAWGREKVDIAAVGGNAGPADGPEGEAIAAALRAPSAEACASGLVLALKRGVSLDAAASVVLREAALRLAGAAGPDASAVHGVLLSEAARWGVRFSRTESRVLPVLQAALLVRSLPAGSGTPRPVRPPSGGVLLRDLAGAIEAGKAVEATDLALTASSGPSRVEGLAELLAYQASRRDPRTDGGHDLALADAALGETAQSPPAIREAIPALARGLALGPRDWAGWPPLEARFGRPATSS